MKSSSTGQVKALYFHCNPNCSSSAGKTLHGTQVAACHFNSSLHGSQPILSNHRGLSTVQSSLFHEASLSTAYSGYFFFCLLLFYKLMKYGVSMILPQGKPTRSMCSAKEPASQNTCTRTGRRRQFICMPVIRGGKAFRLIAVWKTSAPLLRNPLFRDQFHVPLTDAFPGS